MLATPARIAGCKKVVLCSPPPIADEILYAAQLCGVQEVFKVGARKRLRLWHLARNQCQKSIKSLDPATPS
jgi:histidinol dehydrogenase